MSLLSGSGILLGFVPSVPWLFFLLRVTCGMGGMGCYMVAFVLITECTTPRYFVPLQLMCGVGFVWGELVLALEAYLVREWFSLQMVSYAPVLFCLSLYFLVPESPRWLVRTGRLAEAKAELRNIARCNGIDFPERHFSKKSGKLKSEESEQTNFKAGIGDLFRNRVIAGRTVNMFFQWASTSMAYFGVTFASTSLAGDPYLNFALVILIELLHVPFEVFLVDLLGRRFNLSSSQLTLGVCSVGVGLIMNVETLLPLQGLNLRFLSLLISKLLLSVQSGPSGREQIQFCCDRNSLCLF